MSDRREEAGGAAAAAAASAASAASTAARAAGRPDATAKLVGNQRWWSLVALCLSAAIVWFAAANIPVATTAISDDIGGSVTALQWANTIFTLTCGALVIAAGRLGDIFGRRQVLGIGLVIFAAASVVAALAPSPELLIAGRALMGVGAAAILPATLAIIPHRVPRQGPGDRLQRLDGGHRRRPGGRAGHLRRPHAVPRLAGHLLGQRPALRASPSCS